MKDCLFCKIVRGEIPSKKVHEDEHVFAFHDISPQAPNHVLVVPKLHAASLDELGAEHAEVAGRLFLTASSIVKKLSGKSAYRCVVNTGAEAGQSVFHLHLHVLWGRTFGWPPG